MLTDDAVTDSQGAPSLPDILSEGLSVIFCGLNPGLGSAREGRHFSNGSNRFWRTLHLAGFTPEQIRPADDRTILKYGYGLTTVVQRPSSSADEISTGEFRDAAAGLERKIRRYKPVHVAFLGKAAYAAISGRRQLSWGPQHASLADASIWILPNPSGLNRSFSLDQLIEAYGQLRQAIE